jgi:thiopeptide-type bacteriocin biosynthesis protein
MTDEWLYYRVYVADLGEIRDLVERVVRPAIADFTARVPDLRWFFLQYVDVLGVHLRLRLRAGPAPLAEFERRLDHDFARALDDPSTVGGRDRDRGFHRRAVKRLYEPEFDKFGGPAGVSFAEHLLQLGSEAALACAEPHRRQARTRYAAAHTALLVDRLPATVQASFLHHYAWYWSGAGPRAAMWQLTRAKLAPGNAEAGYRAVRLRAQIDEVLAEPAMRAVLTGYADGFWRHLASPARAAVDRSDHLILFHHIHLMNNRLGVVPGEEVQIARLLWLDRLTRDTCHAGGHAGSTPN